MGKYDDIIHLPRPEVSGRHRMSRQDRAAQFSPFAFFDLNFEDGACGIGQTAAKPAGMLRTEHIPLAASEKAPG